MIHLNPDMRQQIAADCRRFQLSEEAAAILDIARQLKREGYRFARVTRETRARVNGQAGHRDARDLRDVFGWNRPFYTRDMPPMLTEELMVADALERLPDGRLRSRIGFSTIADLLVLHDGVSATHDDPAFFRADTYRFVQVLRGLLPGLSAEPGALLELCAGSGAAGLCLRERFGRVVMADADPRAVRYAQINAILAECAHAEAVYGLVPRRGAGEFDAIVVNPPCAFDPAGRWYGGDRDVGIGLAARLVEEALPLLAPGGRLVLCAFTPVIAGEDRLQALLAPLLARTGLPSLYEEIDVDVRGADLRGPAYEQIERLAVAALQVGPRAASTPVDDELCVLWGPCE